MTLRILICFVLLLGSAFSGCGYTILRRDPAISNPCAGLPDSTLPDLEIIRIAMVEVESPPNIRTNHPRGTILGITMRNRGPGVFDGSILCNYAIKEEDHESGKLPAHADPFTIRLQSGDTTIVVVTVDRWFTRNTHLRCELRTDSFPLHTYYPIYFFGREPVCEASYINNVAEYLIE